jgi:UDP-glucose 4-epimerase
VLRVALGEATHVQIFGQDYSTPDGTCIRDFIHVRDLGAAHLLALEATGDADPSLEVYNLGSAAGFSVRAIPARVVKRRMGDPPVLVASSRRARRELGWQPQHSKLEEMLTDAWAWHLANPRGYADTRRPAQRGSDRDGSGVAAARAVSGS